MGNLNSFFKSDGFKSTNLSSGLNTGLNIANAFLNTGNRNDNAWSNGGNVGATGFSNVANSLGSIAGQFGPYGVAAQAALQGISGMADLFSYKQDVKPLENTYSSDELPSFDLSTQASQTDQFMGDFNKSANKKVASTALLGGVGIIGGLIGKNSAKKKAQEANAKMQSEYSGAIDRFNVGTESYYNKQNTMDLYRARKQAQGNIFGMPSASPFFYLG